MNEDDCFMSDTLNEFTFNTQKKLFYKKKESLDSQELSFDDSAFLDNLTFDFELAGKVITGNNSQAVNNSKKDNIKQCVTQKPSPTTEHSDTKLNVHVSDKNESPKATPPGPSTQINAIDNKSFKNSKQVTSQSQDSNTSTVSQLSLNQISCNVSSNSNSQPHTLSHEILSMPPSNTYELSAWGLPELVFKKYSSRKIKNMFPWQYECLSNPKVLHELSNLIYSAPTSAGKTLVAEILAIKTIFERKKKVILILPFVSIVREKMYYFQDILGTSGIRVEAIMGSYNPPGGFKSIHFAICTIEKANGLINKLMEENKLSDIGCILVDEMHLLGDSNRGYILELLLTKLRYISLKDENVKLQIVGMSATLPNLDQLAKWLGAELFSTTFRPIPLYEQVIIGGNIYDRNMQLVKKLDPLPDICVDTDNVLQLCLDTIKDSCSVLIFCPSKNWCENLAQQLAVAFYKIGNSDTPLGELLRTQIKSDLVVEVLEQLKFCPVGLDSILKRTASLGIAFHHAGLTVDERDIIEAGFRNGAIKIIVATSTLSSGVNLPARRVIIRSPVFCGKPIDLLTYKQMAGRAGRMGKDTMGESILICQQSEQKIAKLLLSGQLPAVQSCLETGDKLERAILEVIASGVASKPEDVTLFTNCTLLSVINEGNGGLEDPIGEAIEYLKKNEFIRLQSLENQVSQYVATSLGKACLSSSIAPDEGLALFAELEKARQCFVLESELHLIYLVTPYSACHSWGNIDWMFYLNLWEKLPTAMKRVGELVGVREAYIVNASRRKIDTNSSSGYKKLMVHKRFFVALALQDLVNEIPLGDVCAKFNCNRGMLQSLQQSASTFAGMVTSFSRQLGWASVEILLAQFQDRMQFGVSRDLLDLMRLPSLNGKLARTLYNAGIETVVQLANHDVATVETVLCRAGPFERSKEREGESEFDYKQRNKLRTVWITGKDGLTERQAAELLVQDARNYLKTEMGLQEAKWESSACSQGDKSDDITKRESVVEVEEENHNEKDKEVIDEFKEQEETPDLLENSSGNSSIKSNLSSFGDEEESQSFLSPNKASTLDKNEDLSLADEVMHADTQLEQKTYQSPEYSSDYQTDTFETVINKKLVDTEKPKSPKSPKSVASERSYDFNLSNNSSCSMFSDISFTRIEENLDIGCKEKVEIVDLKQCDQMQDECNNSPVKNTSRKSSTGFISGESLILEQISIEDFGMSEKSDCNIDEFETQGNFDKALQDFNFTHEIEKNSNDYLGKNQLQLVPSTSNANLDDILVSSRKRNRSANNLELSSEDSLVESTPPKKIKMLNNVTKTPFSSTIKRISQISLTSNSENKSISPLFTNVETGTKNTISKHVLTKETPMRKVSVGIPSKTLQLKQEDNSISEIEVLMEIAIVDVCTAEDSLVASFLGLLQEKSEFSLCCYWNKIKEIKPVIGANILELRQNNNISSALHSMRFKDKRVEALAFYWGGKETYYLSTKNLIKTKQWLTQLRTVFGDEKRYVRMFNAKEQIKILKQCCDIDFRCKIEDPAVADWLLDAEERERNLEEMAKSYSHESNKAVVTLFEKLKRLKQDADLVDESVISKVKSVVEAVYAWRLIETLTKKLTETMPKIKSVMNPHFPSNYDLEMQTQVCLANLELTGMGINCVILQDLADMMKIQQGAIEKKAYSLAGRRFNFNSSKDVSKVTRLYKGKKGSTKRMFLEQSDHPISELVINWRKINHSLTKMVYPFLRACDSDRIYGNYYTHTATGRITMHEPNIQMVTKDFKVTDFTLKKEIVISCRKAFTASQGFILVSADYCQLELRILTYLSQDSLLKNIMDNPGDIFKSVAAKWNNVSEDLRQ
ncbi:DNA polymerase theta isoform X2 [Anthonomus grandis grandis]|uniref:DNA polymerase theta isoform X2 n=1 Tax=Anthonomus grandis grandis TaxID=2921223 RepID=UPI002164F96D|nr:DNA polymerase theta isoform X2 [Anthonomus grandis grandis]